MTWGYGKVRQSMVISRRSRPKNEHLRFCAGYRKLDDVMKRDCFPLPWTDNSLDTLDAAKWFSSLILKSGYWNVDLHPDSLSYTLQRSLYLQHT
jgi:hypothetical protein